MSLNLELWVLQILKGAHRSREVLETEYPDVVWDEDRILLHNLSSIVHRQGMLLALLALVPATREELMSRMPALVDSAPAWLDAQVRGGEPMTVKLFARGLAQTLTAHRAAVERVVSEQVANDGPIHEILREAPVPAGAADEEQGPLVSGVFGAMTAHTEALCGIARDVETDNEE